MDVTHSIVTHSIRCDPFNRDPFNRDPFNSTWPIQFDVTIQFEVTHSISSSIRYGIMTFSLIELILTSPTRHTLGAPPPIFQSQLRHCFNNVLVLLKQLRCLCWSQSWVTVLVSPRVHVVLKTWKCSEWRCIQNEVGVEITFGTETYLFFLFCMTNFFVRRMPSSHPPSSHLKFPFHDHCRLLVCFKHWNQWS